MAPRTGPRLPRPTMLCRPFAGAKPTPMMAQYLALRQDPQYAGHVVFFQMGEFYECFFEDAEVVSRTLGIALTARGRHLGMPIPMAGVPLHAGGSFLGRMVKAGFKVVVVDQIEAPGAAKARSKPGAPSLVRRSVTRVVTPGTATEEALLSPGQNNFAAAVHVDDGEASQSAVVAWCDVSTGQLHVTSCDLADVQDVVEGVSPRELLLPPADQHPAAAQLHGQLAVRALNEGVEEGQSMVYRLTCGVAPCVTVRQPAAPSAAHPELSPSERAAVGDLVSYVAWTQGGAGTALQAPVRVGGEAPPTTTEAAFDSAPPLSTLGMDHWTRRALELHRPLHGRHRGRGSLLHAVDFTVSSAGARLLDRRLASPLANCHAVRRRLEAVSWWHGRGHFRRRIRAALAACTDVERAMQRVLLSAARAAATHSSPQDEPSEKLQRRTAARSLKGTPRGGESGSGVPREADLLAVRDTLAAARDIGSAVQEQMSCVLEAADVLPLASVDFDSAAVEHVDTLNPALCAALQVVAQPEVCQVFDHLCKALVGTPPLVLETKGPGDQSTPPELVGGSAIRTGYDEELDALRALRDRSADAIDALQRQYRTELGIPTLKVKHTAEQGFTIEVPAKSAGAVPTQKHGQDAATDGQWVWSRTLKNTVRFKNTRLSKLDRQLADAANKAAALERSILRNLAQELAAIARPLAGAARALAVLDVTCSHAHAAETLRLCMPKVHSGEHGGSLVLKGGRHAVVERGLLEAWAYRFRDDSAAAAGGLLLDRHVRPSGGSGEASAEEDVAALQPPPSRAFVANDTFMVDTDGGLPPAWNSETTGSRCMLITGPNMGGKSTYLRQIAQAVILAQAGSFVPADDADIGICDAVFARVGASDDVARDRSTFMCEMSETAALLRRATKQSLVVVDEVGRGTAALDGLAIAWAVLEHLAGHVHCRALFATHFHELSKVAAQWTGPGHIGRYTVGVELTPLGPVLTHKVQPGECENSFGLHVAQMAGMPAPVLERAEQLLAALEAASAGSDEGLPSKVGAQLSAQQAALLGAAQEPQR